MCESTCPTIEIVYYCWEVGWESFPCLREEVESIVFVVVPTDSVEIMVVYDDFVTEIFTTFHFTDNFELVIGKMSEFKEFF